MGPLLEEEDRSQIQGAYSLRFHKGNQQKEARWRGGKGKRWRIGIYIRLEPWSGQLQSTKALEKECLEDGFQGESGIVYILRDAVPSAGCM